MCWGAGILLSSGVVRAVAGIAGNTAWRLPFALQWVWPIPLIIGAYFAPESPWNAVRRDKFEEARKSLRRLRDSSAEDFEIDATLAYIQHTTALEKAETQNASFFELFQGTNLRRTEIVSLPLFSISHHLTLNIRTALSGRPKSSAETPFSATQSSSLKPQASRNCKPSTLTSPYLHATSSAASSAGFYSLISVELRFIWVA